jgi:hypothetical protein
VTNKSTTISELANSILLDDLTDVFYRTLVFSHVVRSEYDTKSLTEQKLDTKLEQKLARQLNWSAALTSLEPATHRLSHFLKLVLSGKLTTEELADSVEDNYWLQNAISSHSDLTGDKLIHHFADYEFLLDVCFQTLYWQSNDCCRDLLRQVYDLAKSFVTVESQSLTDSEQNEMFRLALLNVYPMFVLIKLFDRNFQSMIQDELNTLPLECEKQRANVKQYRPCAETVLHFLMFDEFVKPHVLESLSVSHGVLSNLVVDEQSLNELEMRFLQQRTSVITNQLRQTQILTQQQLFNGQQQIGINFQLNNLENLNQKYLKVLTSLVPVPGKKDFGLSFS